MVDYKIIKRYLTLNKWSRPGKKIKKIKGIAIHWIASPMGTASGVFNYFENRKYGNNNYGSAQECICLNGDIYQYMPENEVAYAVGSKTYTKKAIDKFGYNPNYYTYSIECCHIDWNGKMTDETYNSLVDRCVDLCKQWKLDPLTDLWLHQEIVGWKDCHKWFVNNPNEWEKLKQLVNDKINNNPKIVIGDKIIEGIIHNNNFYAPTRKFSELLGFNVVWERKTGNVYVGKVKIETININGISYSPIRYLAETLGYVVDWDNKSKTATIYK